MAKPRSIISREEGAELHRRHAEYPLPPSGPPRLPPEIRATLGEAIAGIVKQGDIQDKFRAIGFEPTGLGPQQFADHHAAEVKRWVAFMTETGMRK